MSPTKRTEASRVRTANIDEKNDKAIKREIVSNVEEYYTMFCGLVTSRKGSEEQASESTDKAAMIQGSKTHKSSRRKRSIDEIDMENLAKLYRPDELLTMHSIADIIKVLINHSHSATAVHRCLDMLLQQQPAAYIEFLNVIESSQLLKSLLMKLFFTETSCITYEKLCLGALAMVLSMNQSTEANISDLAIGITVSLEFMDCLYLMGFLGVWMHRLHLNTNAVLAQLISKLLKVAISRWNQDQSKKLYTIDLINTLQLCSLSLYLALLNTNNKEVILDVVNLAVTIKGSHLVDFSGLLTLPEDFVSKGERNILTIFQRISKYEDAKKLVSDKLLHLLPTESQMVNSGPADDQIFEPPSSLEEVQDEDLFVIDKDGDKSVLEILPSADDNEKDNLEHDVKTSLASSSKAKPKAKRSRTKL